MSNLSELDKLAGIKFGIVKNVDDFFIKIGSELFIKSSTANFDLFTISSDVDRTLDLYGVEFEIEKFKTYYLYPILDLEPLKDFKVTNYIFYYECEDNTESNQLEFIDDLIVDKLRCEIGSKKLLLSCWPFSNFKLTKFLQKCGIDYEILLNDCTDKSCGASCVCRTLYIYDEDNIPKTYGFHDSLDDEFSVLKFKSKKDMSTSGNLFCTTHGNMYFKISWGHIPYQYYNGSSMTSASEIAQSDEYNAFIIFNPKSASDAGGLYNIVLPNSDDFICQMCIFEKI